VGTGVFLILVARCAATVWDVHRSREVYRQHCQEDRRRQPLFVSHHGSAVGHVTIKMSGHPPFAAQIIRNGHEYVAAQARAAGIGFTNAGNCFTRVADPAGLAQIADTLSHPATAGRLQPGLRPVDLFGVPVFRAGPRRASTQRVQIRLLSVSG
jgi:hypothetical protein